jgi:hypothetical protein
VLHIPASSTSPHKHPSLLVGGVEVCGDFSDNDHEEEVEDVEMIGESIIGI